MNIFKVRFSDTKYGSKIGIRIWRANIVLRVGRLPWASSWDKPVHVKRISRGRGLKWSLHYRDWTFTGQVEPANHTPRSVKKLIECPRCGYRNKTINFFQRREHE